MPATIIPFEGVFDRISEDPSRQRAFVALAAFLAAFLLIRTSARMTRRFTWWPGGVRTGSGIHLHHFVWGIFIMLGSGFLTLSLDFDRAGGLVLAAVFGLGGGLVLDEFALWTRLEDVYWSAEGRSSVEAVAVVAVFGLLIVAGVRPFSVADPLSAAVTGGVILVPLAVAIMAILKGRTVIAAIGIFLLPIGLWAAFRVGKPASPWSHWFYAEDSARMRRARERFQDPARPSERLRHRLIDAVGGAPTTPPAPRGLDR